MNKFYMVYVENGNTPAFKHQYFELAETEAKRLAKLTGKKTFVLMAIEGIELNEFKIDRIADDADLPF